MDSENIDYILNRDLKDLPGERWVFIPGYGFKYQISNLGRVKSFIKRNPVILQKTISNGKHKVLLYYKAGRFKNMLVGRLVCTAFNGEPEENDVVVYLDGNKLNDAANNVMWKSRAESIRNTLQKVGCPNRGELNGMAKLNADKVKEIKRLRKEGNSYKYISSMYGVAVSTIQNIAKGQTWKTI